MEAHMNNFPKQKLSTKEAAAHLGISSSYLEKLRVIGSSCPYLKIGSRVVYDVGDLNAWAAERMHRSTAEYT
jgi:hypothetical protein